MCHSSIEPVVEANLRAILMEFLRIPAHMYRWTLRLKRYLDFRVNIIVATLCIAEGATSILHKNAPSLQSKKQMQSGPRMATHAPPNKPSEEDIGALMARCSLKFLKIFTRDKDSRIAKSPVPTYTLATLPCKFSFITRWW